MPRPKIPLAAQASPDDIEQQFYEALQRGDIEQLMAAWSDDDEIVCVHPGGQRLVGPGAIRSAFDNMFAAGTVDVQADKVRRLHSPGCAVHSVLERIRVLTDEGPQTAWVIATNVYVQTAQGWRLVAHHASPGSPREVQDVAEPTSTLH